MPTYQRQNIRTGRAKRTGEDDLRTAVRLFIAFLVLCAAVAGGLVLFFHLHSSSEKDGGRGFFTVREITVTGNTRYQEGSLVAYSGILMGQNVFQVNKVRAAEQLMETFPYIAALEISTPKVGTVSIEIIETQPYVAVELTDGWAIIGENNRIVELLPHEEFHTVRYPRISGVALLGEEVGATAFDVESLSTVNEILQTADAYKCGHIAGIDMTSRARVTVNWNNRIDIRLGTMLNTDKKFAAATAIMERLLSAGDPTLSGTLDVSSYSGSDPEKYSGVFLRTEYQAKMATPAE